MSTIITYKPYDYVVQLADGPGSNVINRGQAENAKTDRETFTPNYNYLLNDGTIAGSGLVFQDVNSGYKQYDENYEKVVSLNLGTTSSPESINISTNG